MSECFCFHDWSWSCCCLPSTAECFDEGYGSDELLATQRGGGKFDVQGGALSGRHFEIRDEAVSVCMAASVVIRMFWPLQSRLGFDGL